MPNVNKKQIVKLGSKFYKKANAKQSRTSKPKFCQYKKGTCAFPECGCNKLSKVRVENLRKNSTNVKISRNTTTPLVYTKGPKGAKELPKLTVQQHYRGMPEYVQKDLKAYRKVVVHLADEDAVRKFFKLINQSYTEKTNSVQFPEGGEDKYMDKRYTDKKKK